MVLIVCKVTYFRLYLQERLPDFVQIEMKKQKDRIEAPMGETRVLLHTCCAPCSSAIIEAMMKNGITPVIYYCNPNIYPYEEYLIRKDECTRYAKALGLEIIDADYDHENWLAAMKGLENEPERGGRCLKCFKLRLLRTAEYARDHGFKVIATTLASSRWKSLDQINEAGLWACHEICPSGKTVDFPDEGQVLTFPSGKTRENPDENVENRVPPDDSLSRRISAAPLASARCSENIAAATAPDNDEVNVGMPQGAVGFSRLGVENVSPDDSVIWWDQNWRKGGLQERRNQILKEYDFYNQLYCGCEFSIRKEADQ